MWIVGLVLLATAVVAVLVLLRARNRMADLRHRVENGRRQIDVQLARRHDLIPSLVEVVRGAMKYEHETLEALVRACGEARRALVQASGEAAPSLDAEARLSTTLSQTLSLVDQHPELRALANVRALQEELASTENRIAFARQHYNDVATAFNAARDQLPASLFGRGSMPAALWEAPAGAAEMPALNLNIARA
jgi:LemA protein